MFAIIHHCNACNTTVPPQRRPRTVGSSDWITGGIVSIVNHVDRVQLPLLAASAKVVVFHFQRCSGGRFR